VGKEGRGCILSPIQNDPLYAGRHMPIFLITVFAKNEQVDLTTKEQDVAVELSEEIVAIWSDKQ
jgi:hypothetical protein